MRISVKTHKRKRKNKVSVVKKHNRKNINPMDVYATNVPEKDVHPFVDNMDTRSSTRY